MGLFSAKDRAHAWAELMSFNYEWTRQKKKKKKAFWFLCGELLRIMAAIMITEIILYQLAQKLGH